MKLCVAALRVKNAQCEARDAANAGCLRESRNDAMGVFGRNPSGPDCFEASRRWPVRTIEPLFPSLSALRCLKTAFGRSDAQLHDRL